MYEAVAAQILADAPAGPDDGPMTTTVTFRALAPELTMLTDAERRLLDDWLARAITSLTERHSPPQ